jgi:serine/threonine-protein kinase
MIMAHEGLPVRPFPEPPPSTTTTAVSVLPAAVQVPDLIGLTVDEAAAALAGTSLQLAIQPIVTDDHPPGVVFNQSPTGGTSVPGGFSVIVEVAEAPQALTVPDVVGLSAGEARATLTAAGFAVAEQAEVDPGGSAPGTVWKQSPGSGTPADVGDTVTIVVNPAPSSTTAPPPSSSAPPSSAPPPTTAAPTTAPPADEAGPPPTGGG